MKWLTKKLEEAIRRAMPQPYYIPLGIVNGKALFAVRDGSIYMMYTDFVTNQMTVQRVITRIL